jgi:hypothetical protein
LERFVLFSVNDRIVRVGLSRRRDGRCDLMGLLRHTGFLSMDIHRNVSTCFEQPSVDIGLHLSPRGFAQANESLLNAILG